MKRGWLGATVILALAVVMIALKVREEQGEVPNIRPWFSKKRLPASAPEAAADRSVERSEPRIAPDPVDPEFQKWLSHEAKSLDHAQVDGDAKEREIQNVVRKLTPPQSRQLLQTARNPVAPAREKILSTYLLVQGGLNSREELRDLAKAPLENSGRAPEPHTMDEIDGVRDKSVRIMAIDGLASQARTDEKARDTLAKTIPEIQDPFVRNYAQKKLDEVSRQ
ncbi:MAG TPA: hypothetical protein PKC28_08290 [Bdellovibrionales bacterium]|nr:hypothetical protein [Bdellovibrionales bacterium]